jgi:hypothetical protein
MAAAVFLLGCETETDLKPTVASAPTPVAASGPVASPASSPAKVPHTDVSPTAAVMPASYLEPLGQQGTVDWSTGVVTATGIGFAPNDVQNATQARLLARRAAQTVAYRNLLEAFSTIRVDSTTTVKNLITTDDEIQQKVQGFIEDAKIIKERDLERGGYEVTVQMKLTGRVSDTFAPKNAPPAKRLVTDEPRDIPSKPGGPYTGLVVDARGIPVRPALLPKLVTEDGLDAYSQSYVLAKYKPAEGIAAYVTDPAQAKVHPKVTNNPLTIKALRTARNSQTDLVISNAAAQTIHAVRDNFEFLERAKVIVIVDPREQ